MPPKKILKHLRNFLLENSFFLGGLEKTKKYAPAKGSLFALSNFLQRRQQMPLRKILSNFPHELFKIFRDVYMGECFTFYISIINSSANTTCKEINIKADVQTQTQRIAIGEMSFNDVSLAPNQQIGRVFTHEIQEFGQHILVCAVTYKGLNEEKLNLRKFFKFPVNKPIELIKQNFYDVENCGTFFEAQIQNLCSLPIFIEAVTLTTNTDAGSPYYTCSEIVSPPMDNTNVDNFLESQSIQQYLFRLKPVDENMAANWRTVLNFGKLSISWRTTMGDRGKIALDTIQRMKAEPPNLRLIVVQNPRRVKVNEIFESQLRLQNCSDRPMDLLITFDQAQQPSIVHCSVSGQHFQPLLPNHSIDLRLDLLPHVHGLQQISGIRVTDLQLKRIYEFDDICQIFVH